MKLMSLNVWGGRLFNPLISFLQKYSQNIDVFCLQEVFNNSPNAKSAIQQGAKEDIYLDIKKALSGFDAFIAPAQDNEESLAMFIRRTLLIKKIDDVFVYRWKNAMVNNDASTYGVNIQYAQFQQDNKYYTVCNLHGHWTPNFKGDNPARLEQFENIKRFLDGFDCRKILCGDFNVASNTKSVAILESSMRNLISEYKITSTRSHLYTKEVKFADYIMVSPEVRTRNFEVLQVVVSDHLPLLIEFD